MQPVRRRITEILKEKGGATVAELADELGMAQVSVRHHLDILMGEDLVQAAGVRRRDGAGRPSQVYMLTPAADKLFPQRHDILANNLLTEFKALLPIDEVRGVFLRLAEKGAREAPPAFLGQSMEDRLTQVAIFLTQRGHNARWEGHDGRYELYACNCPYAGVSDQHAELCLMDQTMIQHLIPEAVRIESQALNGASHCTFVIDLTSKIARPGPGEGTAAPEGRV